MKPIDFPSDHFQLLEVANDVYAAIGSACGGAHSNSGIMMDYVRKGIDQNRSPSELVETPPFDPPLDAWLMGGMLHLVANINFLYNLYQSDSAD